MSKHSELAKENFIKGYNCAQSIVLAFCDVTGLEEETSLKIASSFGGGMGRLREVCGALSGVFIIAGLLYGPVSPTNRAAKAEHYALIRHLAKQFKDLSGSIICRELLGVKGAPQSHIPQERDEKYYKSRPCVQLVAGAAEILDRYIETQKINEKI